MMWIKIVLTSAVISSLISLISNLIINNKNNSLKYITEERKNWRKYLREECPKLISDKYKKDWDEIVYRLELNLNPYDIDDINILILAKAISKELTEEVYLLNKIMFKKNRKRIKEKQDIMFYLEQVEDINCEFLERISTLLKNDWERSKYETKLIIFTLFNKIKWRYEHLKLNKENRKIIIKTLKEVNKFI